MTEKEFIILHQEQHGWDVSTIKALEKDVKALEQEPCEDCVSRQSVKDIIRKYKNDSECLISWVMDSICDLLSVTPMCVLQGRK